MTQQVNFNRRNFLKTASAATLGALATGDPRQILAKADAARLREGAHAHVGGLVRVSHGLDLLAIRQTRWVQLPPIRAAGTRYESESPAS